MMQFSKLLGKVDTLIEQQRQIIALLESKKNIEDAIDDLDFKTLIKALGLRR